MSSIFRSAQLFLAMVCMTLFMASGCQPPAEKEAGSTVSEKSESTEEKKSDDHADHDHDHGDHDHADHEHEEHGEKKEESPSTETEETKEDPASDQPVAEEKEEAPKEEEKPEPKEEVKEEPTPAPEPEKKEEAPVEEKKEEAPAEEEKTTEKEDESEEELVVMLGSEELTSGIPGEGDLTVEEIQKWLDNEENHKPLTVTLPLGLAAGAAKITGLDENPMTKAKIELGRQLYFDPRLSSDSTVSCASCHHPDEGWAKHTQFGVGIQGQEGGRNSPVSFNRIFSGPQFWDGRAATLEEQAVGPIANPIEMGNTHEVAVETVKKIEGYKIQFDKIFEDGVNIDNIGKAIATFERAIVTGPSAYDIQEEVRRFEQFEEEDIEEMKEDDPELYERYTMVMKASKENPMSREAQNGRDLFFSDRVGCTACHVGVNFTDELYHNLGIGMDKEEPDLGRYEVTGEEKDKGAFKTPTVRNIAMTAPYMHDGATNTLEEIVEIYAKGGHPNPYLSDKIKKIDLTDQEKKDLVEFMKALTGEFPKVEPGRLPKS